MNYSGTASAITCLKEGEMKQLLLVAALAFAVAGVASADRGPGNSRGVGQAHQGGTQHQAQTRGNVQAHQGVGVQQHQVQGRAAHDYRGGIQVQGRHPVVQSQGRDVVRNNRDVLAHADRGVRDHRGGGQAHQGRDVTHNDYRTNYDVRGYHRDNTRIDQRRNNHVRPAHVAPFVYHEGIRYETIYRDGYWGYWHTGVWFVVGSAIIGTVAVLTRPGCYYEDREVIDRYGRLIIRTVEICPTRW